jgi:hypothetical protein
MKYLKLFEKLKNYKFNKGDYVKVLPEAGPRIDMDNREHMVYQIVGRRKKAQGWTDDSNVYKLKQAYEPYENLDEPGNWEFNEKGLRELTEKEKEELELRLAAKKYNL